MATIEAPLRGLDTADELWRDAGWNVLTNIFQEVNLFTFIDSTTMNASMRFYRLALP